MVRNNIVAMCGLMLIAIASTSIQAQDDLLIELYGRGVHAYFDGEYEDADKFLTMAVDEGSRDPRVYYYRGMSLIALGRPDEAKSDFTTGAEIEVKRGNQSHEINVSIQRLQGSARLQLEQIRTDTRLETAIEERKDARGKYQKESVAEDLVLRNENDNAAPAPTLDVPVEKEATDPFGSEAGPGTGIGQATPVPAPTPATPGQANPFTDDPEPTTNPDPFGGTTPAPAKNDPFGTPQPDANDPFGGNNNPSPAGPPAAKGGGSVGALSRAVIKTVPFAGALGGLLGGGGPPVGPPPGGDDFGNPPPDNNDPFGGQPNNNNPPPANNDPFGGGNDPFGGDAAPKPAPPQPAPGGNNDPFGGGATPAPPQPAPGRNDDPFGGGATPAPPQPAPGGNDDPFGGGATPAPPQPAPGGNDDPFGGGATPAPPQPAPGGNDDPFGGNDDPFGGGAAPAPPKPAPGGNDDPFGN